MARGKPDFGPAVKDGVLCRTSVSAIQSFDPETYGGCNRRYYFEYVLGLETPETRGQKVGHEGHEQIEHYLKTGADVLQPFARAGKHLLPRPGSDLHVEDGFATNEATKAAIALCASQPKSITRDREVAHLAGLSAAGIPLVGYIDVRHRRGEYVGADGVLYRESQPERTSEVIDHKFSADINTYGKTADEVVATVQMTGYTVHVGNVEPGVGVVRNSHIYYQTRGAKTARKITKLVVVDDARRRWERVEGVVRAMVDVVKATDVKLVEPYTPSCDAYRGCPHRKFCPDLPIGTVFDLLGTKEGADMSGKGLFDGVATAGINGTSVPAGFAPPPPTTTGRGLFDDAAPSTPPNRAPGVDAVPAPISVGFFAQTAAPALPGPSADSGPTREAEIARLLAEEEHPCMKCGAHLCPENTARLPDGEIRHVGCPGIPFGTVNPPGGAPPTPLELAQPVDPSVLADPDLDPEIRARAQALADEAVRAALAAGAGSETKKGGRCSASDQRVAITPKQAATKSYVCHACGKELKITPSEDYTEATLKRHNLPKPEAPQAAPSTDATSGNVPPPLPAGIPPLPAGIPPLPAAPPLEGVPPLAVPPLLPEDYRAPDAFPSQQVLPFGAIAVPRAAEEFQQEMAVARRIADEIVADFEPGSLSRAEFVRIAFEVRDRIRAVKESQDRLRANATSR